MPLNKLENFIKNYEGRILYVNSNDLDATDSISNQGNSLTKPFKTIQRALLESARFSFVAGENNDKNDRTTILVYPGEHVIDNRPGYRIVKSGTALANAISPSGEITSPASDVFNLSLESNFDLTQEDNILYKFNSVNGGVILPRGTSLIGLDLRKTKIRPKYVPNPTDDAVDPSAIFRITGNCFFWQFSIFDALQTETVYTNPQYFGFDSGNQSIPTFSHHKLTVFEYADGVNTISYNGNDTGLSDLDMYYAKLSNAYNEGSNRQIPSAQKYPILPAGFAKERPEWEIVGAFGTDPIAVTDIYSGDRATPSTVVRVTTQIPHNLTVDTPIKIKGSNVADYNITTVVQTVSSPTTFTYLLQSVRNDLPADPGGSVEVIIETDTVKGASPYVFNCSMRSVWGMNGMHADGNKASGFRSMVVAQYTAVSLQKDDRAFVKYDPISRTYKEYPYTKQTGSALSSGSASTNSDTVYHLDSRAIYRKGWETSHIKFTNDAFIQIVSVFAIGFNKHFDAKSGGDGSITNSNSNFGQISLAAEGFKKNAFLKDNYAYITSVITPKHVDPTEQDVDWISFDVQKTINVGISSHLYLFGFNTVDNIPPSLIQGYRVGARQNDIVYLDLPDGITTASANIFMTDNVVSSATTASQGTNSSYKEFSVTSPTYAPNYDTLGLGVNHNIQTGEKILILSEIGDLPENINANQIYYAINDGTNIKIASSYTNAVNGVPIVIYGGTQLKILSRVSDKETGELGSPIQYDPNNSNWFIHVELNNSIYTKINEIGVLGFDEARTDVSYIKRIADNRSLDEKIFKFRISIPKESPNSRDLTEGFIIQESSKTDPVNNSEFTLPSITRNNFDYQRNPRFISTCSVSSGTVTVIAEKSHNLNIGDRVFIKNVKCSVNTTGIGLTGYNGDFTIASIPNSKTFTYSTIDNNKVSHNVGIFSSPISRNTELPRFERNDLQSNPYIYRNEVIKPYINNVQDGVYHSYILKSDVTISNHFTNYKYNQNVVDLYPQLDRDNLEISAKAATSYAKVSPLGDVVTNDLKKSITRETLDTLIKKVGLGITITNVSSLSSGISTITLGLEHGLNGIVGYGATNFGTGTNGTYYNVRLLNNDGITWNGATATVIVSGGNVTSVSISDGGSGYANGDVLKLEGFTGSTITVATNAISSSIGNVIQITGDGSVDDGLYRITSIPSKNQIAIARTTGDPTIKIGQYIFNVGPSVVTSNVQNSSSGISTFTFSAGHGLLPGNKFRVIADNTSQSTNHGDFVVKDVLGITSFTAITNKTITSPVRILKHGFSSNDLTSDSGFENLGSRGIYFYDNEYAILEENITTSSSDTTLFSISMPNSGISTLTRFPLGSYIQIDNEILRISSSTLSGSPANKISALRGYFGTSKENHSSKSIIKKISLIPIELRRPSILRASGHTFEYLGYGPGNYSTGLPQIQVKTLTEREDFLVQSQQKSGGSVLYTGMNNNGDFFIGNTKYSATSGTQTTFAIPIPSITGQNPSRLSVAFDEVVVKERILVEGGKSKQILSQFDGPVTFNQNIIINNTQTKINGQLISSNIVKLNDQTDSNSPTTGSVISKGGFGIAKSVNIGGNLNITGVTTFNGEVSFNSGLLPDNLEDAYIGSASRPWASAWIGGIGIATEGVPGGTEIEDRTIEGLTGNLVLKSKTGITSVTDNLQVGLDLLVKKNTFLTGIATVALGLVPDADLDAYLGTSNKAFSEAYIDGIRIGVGGTTTIDTRGGDLRLDAPTNKVNVLNDLEVTRNTYLSGVSTFISLTTVATGLVPDADVDAYLGTSSRAFSEAYIDGIRIGVGGTTTIDTRGGDLRLNAPTNKVNVLNDLEVTRNTFLTGIATVATGLVPDVDGGAYIGTSGNSFSEAYIDGVRIGVGGTTTIDTRGGDLRLDAFTSKVNVLNDLEVTRNTYLGGITTVATGIVPDADLDAYLGTSSRAFLEAYIDGVRIGVGGTTTIDTRGGDLRLDAFTSKVNVLNDLEVTRNTYLGGITTVATGLVPYVNGGAYIGTSGNSFSEAYIDGVRIGVGGTTTIDTRGGDLRLDAPTNKVNVANDLEVTRNTYLSGVSTFISLTTVATGIVPDVDGGAYIGTSGNSFSEAYIDGVRIGVGGTTTIDTRGGDLRLDAFTSKVNVLNDLEVTRNTNLIGIATVALGLVPDVDGGAYLGQSTKAFSEAYIDGVRIGVGGTTTIDTRGGDLILDSLTDNVKVNNNLLLPEKLYVGSNYNTLYIDGITNKVGIGTSSPTKDFEFKRQSDAEFAIISNTATAKLTVSSGNTSSYFKINPGTYELGIINDSPANISNYIHAGAAGINTGNFNWIYGQGNTVLMSLTYGGRLGIGITNPLNTLHVVGTSTVTSDAYFGNNVSIKGNLTFGSLQPVLTNVNLNNSSGISTFNDITSSRILSVVQIGINTGNPLAEIDVRSGTLLANRIGIGTTVANVQLDVQGGTLLVDSIGIGTTSIYVDPLAIFSSGVQFWDKFISVYDGGISLYGDSSVGFNTDFSRSILDFGRVGSAATTSGYFIAPTITTANRNQLSNNTGVGGTIEGAIIYNSTTKRHQGYGSIDGGTTFGWQNLY
jgi:hypothetical protein